MCDALDPLPVLLADEQVKRILGSKEVVIIQDFDSTHPVWIEITGNLMKRKQREEMKLPSLQKRSRTPRMQCVNGHLLKAALHGLVC